MAGEAKRGRRLYSVVSTSSFAVSIPKACAAPDRAVRCWARPAPAAPRWGHGRAITAKVVDGVSAMSRRAAAATNVCERQCWRQRQPEMVGFDVGLDLEAGEVSCRHLLARAASIRFSRDSSATVPSAISRCPAAKANPDAVQPPDRTAAMTRSRRRGGENDEAERKAGRHLLRQAVEA